jgi:hypothetical protein
MNTTENAKEAQMQSKKSGLSLLVVLGSLLIFIATISIAYYVGWSSTWDNYRKQPLIGEAPIQIQLVKVVKNIPAGGKIDSDNVEEVRVLMPKVYSDSFGFAADCMGGRLKWSLRRGEYVSRHDLLPEVGGDE